MVDATFGVWSWPQLNCEEARNMPRHYVSCKQIFGRYINHYYFAFLLELPYLKIFLICSYLLSVYWSVIKRPTDSTTSTTSGQTDTTSGQTDTTSGQTSTTSGQTSTTSGKTSTTSTTSGYKVLRVEKRVLRVKKRALRVLREVTRILGIIRRVL